jgi:hypothetical protein
MKKNEKADENTDSNNPSQPTQPVVKQNPRLGALGMNFRSLLFVAYTAGGGGGGGGGQQKKPMVIKTNISPK